MAMATTSHPEPNPRMPAPVKADPEDVGEPVLSDDDESVDWVQLLRCYPNARSKDELRDLAMTAGREALVTAAAARANKDLPIPGMEMSDKPEPDKPAPTPSPPPPPPPERARHAN
jgi:hypothetical protein